MSIAGQTARSIGIDSKNKTVELKNHVNDEVTTEKYDKLVLVARIGTHPSTPSGH